MKKLLISGCSNAAGFDISDKGDSHLNRSKSFGNVLAGKFNREPVNAALGGATNNSITRIVLDYCENNTVEDLAVLIAYTDIDRLDVPWTTEIDHTYANTSSNYYKNIYSAFNHINVNWEGLGEEKALLPPYHDFINANPSYMEINGATQTILLQNYLENRSIPYVMCNTMHMYNKFDLDIPPAVALYRDWINTEYYLNPFDNSRCFYWYYRDQGYDSRGDYWHHGEEPHKLYADQLESFIIERGIRTF